MFWLLMVLPVVVLTFREFVLDEDGIGRLMGFMLMLIFAMITAGISLGGAALTGLAFATHPVEKKRVELVAIRDKDGIAGTFFLGSGRIDSDQYYFFYRKLQDGGVQADKVASSKGVRVYEEQRTDAALVSYQWEFNQSWAWLFALPVRDGEYSFSFHVPTGTIRRGFTM